MISTKKSEVEVDLAVWVKHLIEEYSPKRSAESKAQMKTVVIDELPVF